MLTVDLESDQYSDQCRIALVRQGYDARLDGVPAQSDGAKAWRKLRDKHWT